MQWWPNKCGLVESKHVEETHYNIEVRHALNVDVAEEHPLC